MRCPYCGASRGEQLYCWNCGEKMPEVSLEDYLKVDLRRERKQRRYGRSVTVNGVLAQTKLSGDGGSK